jgi:hypothetical protein
MFWTGRLLAGRRRPADRAKGQGGKGHGARMGKMEPAVCQAASSRQGGYAINGDMNRGHASPPRQPYIEVPGLRRPPTYLVPKLKRHSSNAPSAGYCFVCCAVLCCAERRCLLS